MYVFSSHFNQQWWRTVVRDSKALVNTAPIVDHEAVRLSVGPVDPAAETAVHRGVTEAEVEAAAVVMSEITGVGDKYVFSNFNFPLLFLP